MDYDPVEVIRAESDAFLAAARVTDLATPVPSCPEWTLRDLIAHLGAVHRRFGGHVARAGTGRPSGKRPEAPADGILGWFDEGVEALIGVLSAVDPQQPTWNWSTGPQVAAFWARRMALETAVHRWDAEVAAGAPGDFRVAVAVDGVDEVLAVQLPADRLRPDDPEASLAVGTVRVDVDAGRSWLVRMGEDAATDVAPGNGENADAIVVGGASDVFLALWGRVPIEPYVVEGDLALAVALRTT